MAALEIRNVTFSYDGVTPVIKNINNILENYSHGNFEGKIEICKCIRLVFV